MTGSRGSHEDGHRVLVDRSDILGSADRISRLLKEGYEGCFSFEPFAESVRRDRAIEAALAKSMDYLRGAVG
jgi:2-keto-myo-inositol isomerase